MNTCLNCGIEVKGKEGKRAKKFCSDKCRATHYNKNKPKEPKYVQRKTYEALLKENELLKKQKPTGIQDLTQPNKEVKPKEPAKTNFQINTGRPVKLNDEDALDYSARVNEWKRQQLKNQ